MQRLKNRLAEVARTVKDTHGGKSRDFLGLKMADTCQKPSIQVRLSLISPLILIRFAWRLKQTPWENEGNMSILSTLGQRSG